MEYEDVIRAECSYVDESDLPEDLQRPNRVKCELRGRDLEETVFADEWSFRGGMVASGNSNQDYDFVVTDPGDCERNLLSGGSSLTCRQ